MTSNSSPPSAPRKVPLWAFLIVLALLSLALFGERGILRALQYQRQMDALTQKLEELQKTNESLRKEIDALNSNRKYIEGIARKELGMVKEGEVVYRFSPKKENSQK